MPVLENEEAAAWMSEGTQKAVRSFSTARPAKECEAPAGGFGGKLGGQAGLAHPRLAQHEEHPPPSCYRFRKRIGKNLEFALASDDHGAEHRGHDPIAGA